MISQFRQNLFIVLAALCVTILLYLGSSEHGEHFVAIICLAVLLFMILALFVSYRYLRTPMVFKRAKADETP